MLPAAYHGEKYKHLQQKVDGRCDATENLIFSFKDRQRKDDLNTSKKSLVSVTMRHIENFIFTSSYRIRNFHIYAKIHTCGKMLLSYIFV